MSGLLAKAVAVGMLGCLAGCGSKASPHPAELGGCTPTADAACPNLVGTGGGGHTGSGSSGDSGSAATDDASASLASDAGGCGTAHLQLNTMTMACQQCVLMGPSGGGTSCCAVDQACSGACASLVACTQASMCDQICVGICENTYAAGFLAYQDFARCLSMNCSPQCPTLRQ